MFELKEQPVLVKNDDVYSFQLQLTKDGKDISGRQNITAEIKSDDCEIITESVKLSKSTEIQFRKTNNDQLTIYIQPESSAELIALQFQLTDEFEVPEETEIDATDSDIVIEDDVPAIPEIPVESVVSKREQPKTTGTTEYPILKYVTQVEFDYIFTSQIKEILSGEIKSKNVKEIFARAVNITNKIVFFRDTNTSMYYWISKDKILSSNNFTELLIDVNQYNQSNQSN